MKAESTVMPVSPYEIEYNGEIAIVTFYENVEDVRREDDEAQHYSYDFYTIEVRNRPSLINSIDNNIEGWMAVAKEAEYKKLADTVRAKRDVLLAETDWTQVVDSPLCDAQKANYQNYRQALRDIPQQDGFPYVINWP